MIKKILALKKPVEEVFGFGSDFESDADQSASSSPRSTSPLPIPVTSTEFEKTILRSKKTERANTQRLTTTSALYEKLDKLILTKSKTSRSSYTQEFSAAQIDLLQLFGFNVLNFPTEITPQASDNIQETIIRGLVENQLKQKHVGRIGALRIALRKKIDLLPQQSKEQQELIEISKKLKDFKISNTAILEISSALYGLLIDLETTRTTFTNQCLSVLSQEYPGIKKEELEQFTELCFKKYLSQFSQTSDTSKLFEDTTHQYVDIANEELQTQSRSNPFMIENLLTLSKEFLFFIMGPVVEIEKNSSAFILQEFKQYKPNKLTIQETENFKKQLKMHRTKGREDAPGKNPQGACLEKGLEQAFGLEGTCLQTFHEAHVDDKKGTERLKTHLPPEIMAKYHLTETILDPTSNYCTKDTQDCFRLFDEKISPHLFSLQPNQALAIGTDNHIFFIMKEIEKDGSITIKLIDPMNSGTFKLTGTFQASPPTLSTFKINSRIRHKKGDEKTVKEAPEMMFHEFFDLWCKKAHLLDCNIAIISRFEHT